jgi:uncharacterized protein (UPF0548 family)
MLSLTRPSESRIRAFLSRQRGLPYSYPDVGSTFGAPPAGYVVDHNQIRLGQGVAAFERAREALQGWTMSRVGWVEIWPSCASVQVGTTVAILAWRYCVWSLFACRVVRVVEACGPVEEFGFSYGTLPGHLLEGEERFTVRWDRRDDSVWYDLLAFSRPASVTSRLAYPLVRHAQRRFAPDSLRAMARVVAGGR